MALLKNLALVLALFTILQATTSGQGISAPAYFFSYGPDVGDEAIPKTSGVPYGVLKTLSFPGAFVYQGVSHTVAKVRVIIPY